MGVEEEIAAIARDLSQVLGYVALKPQTTSWRELSPFREGDRIPSDHCVVLPDRVFLPVAMKGKLVSSEWKPLIASSLVYYNSTETKRRQRIGLIIALGLAGLVFFPLAPIYLAYGARNPLPTIVPFALLAYLGMVLPFVLYIFRTHQVGTWLIADRLATQRVIERRALVDVLIRIDKMNLKDIEKRKKTRASWLSWRPSISERIQNLTA